MQISGGLYNEASCACRVRPPGGLVGAATEEVGSALSLVGPPESKRRLLNNNKVIEQQ